MDYEVEKMKKFLSVVITVITVALSLPFTAFAAENGFRVYESVIVVSADASATDTYAAQKLKHYLDRITGKSIEITADDTDTAKYKICIASSEKAEKNSADGSYSITSTAEKIIISGAGNKGTINGVYAFLEKYCGCHWYEAQVIIVPENKNLTVPADINISYTPFFEYTETDTASSRDIEFSLANGLTGGAYRDFTVEQGAAVEYLGRFCHTLTTFFCKSETYFEEHPEYFALRNGSRIPDQLCLTNEKVKETVTAEVLALLEAEHNPDADIQIVSLTQHDNQLYCQCKNCKAVDNENGSQSGTMITFVNEIAGRVKEHGYDNVVFDTFAYQYTRKAPTKVVPREDVIVRLCSIECCFGHTLDDPKCSLNADFMNDLREWGKICNRIYIWDYVHNYAQTLCIFPNFGVLQRNVQIFYENNAKGLYEEGNYYIDNSDAEFAEMRTYLLSKLMQNPYLDYEAEISGYLNGVYGAGGCYIKEFLEIISDHAVTDTKHLSIYQGSQNTLYNMTNKDVEKCNELWEKAKAAVETDEQLAQLRRSELSWRYWKSANRRGEFSRLQFPYIWMTEGKKLHDDLKEMNAVLFSEGGTNLLSDCELLCLYRESYKWSVIYEEWFWDIINPYAVDIYNMLGKVYDLFK